MFVSLPACRRHAAAAGHEPATEHFNIGSAETQPRQRDYDGVLKRQMTPLVLCERLQCLRAAFDGVRRLPHDQAGIEHIARTLGQRLVFGVLSAQSSENLLNIVFWQTAAAQQRKYVFFFVDHVQGEIAPPRQTDMVRKNRKKPCSRSSR